MNVFLAVTRLFLAHREKVVLAMMLLLCGAMGGGLALQRRSGAQVKAEALPTVPQLLAEWKPRALNDYPPAELANTKPLDQFGRFLEARPSPFRPVEGGGVGPPSDHPNAPPPKDWPEITVQQVHQPTADGAWIAQLQIGGKLHIAREGRCFANCQYEVQRIDKTRLCVEVLRRLDDEVKEFCKD